MNDFVFHKSKIEQLSQQHATAAQALLRIKTEIQAAREELESVLVAQEITQAVASAVQQQAHQKIAGIVSKCLALVFEEPYVFQIHFEQKRGKTEARLAFSRNGNELDPLEDSGLGVVDVASFALRLAALILGRPPRRRTIVLDEPMKFVSTDHHTRIHTMLNTLAEELDVQLVLVTHIPALQLGTVVEL